MLKTEKSTELLTVRITKSLKRFLLDESLKNKRSLSNQVKYLLSKDMPETQKRSIQ